MAAQTSEVLKGYFAAGKYPTQGNYGDLIDTLFAAAGSSFKTITAYDNTTWTSLVEDEDLTGVSLVIVEVGSSPETNPIKITYQDNGSGQTSWVNLSYGDIAIFTPSGQPVTVAASSSDDTVIDIAASDNITNISDIFSSVAVGKVIYVHNTANTAVNVTDVNQNVICTIQPDKVAQFVNTSSGWVLVGVPIQ